MNSAGSTTGPIWSFTTAQLPAPLPAPWLDRDIGSVGLAGSASYANGVFSVSGAGSAIGARSDSFNYAYQPLATNGQIVARVTGLQHAGTQSQASVMVRRSLAANAIESTISVTSGGTLSFIARSSTGGQTSTIATATQKAPVWLKLARSGSTVTSSWSTDGTSWKPLGTTSISLSGTIYIGLAVASHSTTSLMTGTFDNVTVSPLP